MTQRNPNLARLRSNYLFPEIKQRKNQFLTINPDAKLISLGIGDTTQPIAPSIAARLKKTAADLSTQHGYVGYGPELGLETLRTAIAEKIYHNMVQPDEIFISDGAKCDIGRLQLLFGSKVSIAIQDPAYPVYVDGSLMQGVDDLQFLPCLPKNNFFPDFKQINKCDLIYFCSPNNPTGAAATRKQLEELVAVAKSKKAIIIYDSAYSQYIQDESLPKSIFEIAGADEVALETCSFSKIAGFTGVRLGWTVVPTKLLFEDGFSVKKDWTRIMTTIFNGASIISQYGGLGILEPQGWEETQAQIDYYLENARLLKSALQNLGIEVYGGDNAPYIWARFPGRNSWDIFQELLERHHLITTPGAGFGPSGEEFVRFTAFGTRENILKACERLLLSFN